MIITAVIIAVIMGVIGVAAGLVLAHVAVRHFNKVWRATFNDKYEPTHPVREYHEKFLHGAGVK